MGQIGHFLYSKSSSFCPQVPYKMDPSLTRSDRLVIAKAMDKIRNISCIRQVPHSLGWSVIVSWYWTSLYATNEAACWHAGHCYHLFLFFLLHALHFNPDRDSIPTAVCLSVSNQFFEPYHTIYIGFVCLFKFWPESPAPQSRIAV